MNVLNKCYCDHCDHYLRKISPNIVRTITFDSFKYTCTSNNRKLNRMFTIYNSLVEPSQGVQKKCSSHLSLVWNPPGSMKSHKTVSWSVMLISVKTCTPTQFYLVVPPCTPVLLTVCRRKSHHLPLRQWKSRSLPHPRGNTPSGSVVLSLPLCPYSNRCCSANRNTTNLVHPLFIENVFFNMGF